MSKVISEELKLLAQKFEEFLHSTDFHRVIRSSEDFDNFIGITAYRTHGIKARLVLVQG